MNLSPFLLLTAVSAFTLPSTPLMSKHVHDINQHSSTSLSMWNRQRNDENDDYNLQRSICAFGVASVLAFNTASASALPEILTANEAHTIHTSSIQVSQTIQTMDFSMPSSYGQIADVKNSATAELVQEENVMTGSKKKVKTESTKFNIFLQVP